MTERPRWWLIGVAALMAAILTWQSIGLTGVAVLLAGSLAGFAGYRLYCSRNPRRAASVRCLTWKRTRISAARFPRRTPHPRLKVHESELRPGETPNPAHAHHNEEVIVILAGTLDVTIGETTTRMGAGSVGYAESEDKIGIKLVGAIPAKYIIGSVGDR